MSEDFTKVRVALAFALARADVPQDLALEIDDAVESGSAFPRMLDDGAVILIMSDGAYRVGDSGLERIEQPSH